MESNTNSQDELSEEVDRPEQENDDLGVGRSYECVFCKRGFNTAQALGGHMNIHRKERGGGARNKSTSTKQEHVHAVVPRPWDHQTMLSSLSSPDYLNNMSASRCFESPFSYAAYVPSASSCGVEQPPSDGYYYHPDRDYQQPFNPLVPRLSLEFMQTNREDSKEDMNQKQELDLELRLGYDS